MQSCCIKTHLKYDMVQLDDVKSLPKYIYINVLDLVAMTTIASNGDPFQLHYSNLFIIFFSIRYAKNDKLLKNILTQYVRFKYAKLFFPFRKLFEAYPAFQLTSYIVS